MKVVVFGVTGVIGRAAAEHFVGMVDGGVIGVSRRPIELAGVTHVGLDLTDATEAARAISDRRFAGTTHVVYAALQEAPQLVAGWRDRELMARNLHMFEHALRPLLAAHGDALEHVSLLQGAKAYGLHVGRSPLPARERTARDDHDNFYFLQEDSLRGFAESSSWSWTILRPQIVFGDSIGSPMNLVPAIGVYAALERERGRALAFPGGPPGVHEAVDARLLARALGWAALAPEARNEIFNVTNGDVFEWHTVWPAIAETLGMDVGAAEPQRLAETMPPRAAEWSRVVDRYGLLSPSDMATFVGSSWQYADVLFGAFGRRPLPALLSTVKIRQSGFVDCIDTEDMLREWLAMLQDRKLLPPR